MGSLKIIFPAQDVEIVATSNVETKGNGAFMYDAFKMN